MEKTDLRISYNVNDGGRAGDNDLGVWQERRWPQ